MHDGSNLDTSGIPATIVATTAFVQAAQVQSESLGYDPDIVWVQHPVQDRTDQELRNMADRAFDDIVRKMTGVR